MHTVAKLINHYPLRRSNYFKITASKTMPNTVEHNENASSNVERRPEQVANVENKTVGCNHKILKKKHFLFIIKT